MKLTMGLGDYGTRRVVFPQPETREEKNRRRPPETNSL